MKKDKNKSKFGPQISKEDSIISGERSANFKKGHEKDKLLKKRKKEPDDALDNLDVPGANLARPLTNDRHNANEKKYSPDGLKKDLGKPDSDKKGKK